MSDDQTPAERAMDRIPARGRKRMLRLIMKLEVVMKSGGLLGADMEIDRHICPASEFIRDAASAAANSTAIEASLQRTSRKGYSL